MALKQKKLGSHPLFWYHTGVLNINTNTYYSPKQGRFQVFIADSLNICDPVLAFDKIMEEIGIEQYLKPEAYKAAGRPGYSRVNMLKTILFGFLDSGYVSLRCRKMRRSPRGGAVCAFLGFVFSTIKRGL